MRRAFVAFVLLLSLAAVSCDRGAPAGATVVLLVRHAEKASDAEDSPLTEAGGQRAQALVRAAEDAGVAAVYSTQFRRNLDTARPVSERLGVAVTEARIRDLSNPGDYGKTLAREIVSKHRGRTVLVVGHSNTIASVIEGLTGRAPALSSVEYHDLFVVTAPPEGRAGLIKAQYGQRVGGS